MYEKKVQGQTVELTSTLSFAIVLDHPTAIMRRHAYTYYDIIYSNVLGTLEWTFAFSHRHQIDYDFIIIRLDSQSFRSLMREKLFLLFSFVPHSLIIELIYVGSCVLVL